MQAYTVHFYDLIVIILSISFGSNKDIFKLTGDNYSPSRDIINERNSLFHRNNDLTLPTCFKSMQ